MPPSGPKSGCSQACPANRPEGCLIDASSSALLESTGSLSIVRFHSLPSLIGRQPFRSALAPTSGLGSAATVVELSGRPAASQATESSIIAVSLAVGGLMCGQLLVHSPREGFPWQLIIAKCAMISKLPI